MKGEQKRMSVPNQKKIYIKRDSDTARINYLKVSNESLHEAMFNLKPSTFMLWTYFVDNANGYAMDLYPIDFMNITHLSRTTYVKCFKELEEKGYLIKSTKKDNTYLFQEVSDKAEKQDIIETLDTKEFENIKKELFDF